MPPLKNWTIYKITNPKGRVYIGVSSNFSRRIKRYKYKECKSQTILLRSIIKYGWDAHSVEVLEVFRSHKDTALSKEIFWIKTYMSNCIKYRCVGGMNMTDGGQGTIGYKHTMDAIKKMSEIGRRLRHTDDAKRKISQASKGNKYCLGLVQSKETIAKRQASMAGRVRFTEYAKARSAETKFKPVDMVALDGTLIMSFKSKKDAAAVTGLTKKVVHNAVHGIRKKNFGHFNLIFSKTCQ
jgi:group I intron endonuclease